MPQWVAAGYGEYAKRLTADVRLELIEVALGARGSSGAKGGDLKRVLEAELQKIRNAIGKGDWVVALDVKGRPWSTEQLAQQVSGWQQRGGAVALLVGGPDGLPPDCLALAQQTWSLSDLTFPHPLVRVIVAEQIYRAWSLLNNHPYHRA